MLSHSWLSLCLIWYYTCLYRFFPLWCHVLLVYLLLVSHGGTVLVYLLLLFQFSFLAIFLFLGVIAEFLLSWKQILGLGVHLLELLWVFLHDRHSQRFCIGEWLWLVWNFRLGTFLVHLLEFLLEWPPGWQPLRYSWGVLFYEYVLSVTQWPTFST